MRFDGLPRYSFGKFVDLISHNIASHGEFRKYEKIGFFSISSACCFLDFLQIPFFIAWFAGYLGEGNVELFFQADSS